MKFSVFICCRRVEDCQQFSCVSVVDDNFSSRFSSRAAFPPLQKVSSPLTAGQHLQREAVFESIMMSEVDEEVAVINAVYSRTSDITELERKNALKSKNSDMEASITLASNEISTFGNAALSDKTLSDDGRWTGNESYPIQIQCHNHSTRTLIELDESLS